MQALSITGSGSGLEGDGKKAARCGRLFHIQLPWMLFRFEVIEPFVDLCKQVLDLFAFKGGLAERGFE